jgi:hypothetical protein
MMGLPAVDYDGFIPSLLLDPDDLSNQINHPGTLLGGSVLRPRRELEVMHHSRHQGTLNT